MANAIVCMAWIVIVSYLFIRLFAYGQQVWDRYMFERKERQEFLERLQDEERRKNEGWRNDSYRPRI